MNPFEMVEQFNRDVVGIDRPDIRELDGDEYLWLDGALTEELFEFNVAWTDESIPKQVDALIDLMYFAMGGLTRMGLTAKQSAAIFRVVHNCNMQKHKGAKEERTTVSELDAVKPEGWDGPEEIIKLILSGKLEDIAETC